MRLMKKSEQGNTFEVTHKQLLLTNIERNKGIEPSRSLLTSKFSYHTCFYTSILKSLSVAG